MFFCRATNALISVRLDYNNLRKKYRNFWFLFCSFGLFFYSSFSPSLRFLRLLSLNFSFIHYLSLPHAPSLFHSLSFSHSLTRSFILSLSLAFALPLSHRNAIAMNHITKENCQNMLRWKRHNRSAYTNNSTVEVKVIGGLFIIFFFHSRIGDDIPKKNDAPPPSRPHGCDPFVVFFPPFPIPLPPSQYFTLEGISMLSIIYI